MSRTNNLYKVTIELNGTKADVMQLLSLATRFGVATREINADATAKASKPEIVAPATVDDSKLSTSNKKLVASYQKAGCIGYILEGEKIRPIASHDAKNGGYRYAETTKAGKVVTDDKGRVKSLYNDSTYKVAKSEAIEKARKTGKKLASNYKLGIYRKLGFYIPAKDEKNIVFF